MGIDMRPAGVHAAGSDMNALADRARSTVGRSLDATIDAGQAHAGWSTALAATSCAQAWEQHLREVVDRVGTTGRNLQSAAATTSADDAEAARRLDAVLRELGG